MATGKMSFNYYQNGKYGTLPHNPEKDMEVTQDMHLKMSKKIAQLTKVIYALNTKNDENEAILQGLRDQHEEDKQHLLSDFQSKIQNYRSRLEGETDHRREISILQSRISEYEQSQSSVEARFQQLKEEASAQECKRQEEYSHKVQQLTQEVLRAKREFEEHLQAFEKWRVDKEREHALTLEVLRTQHIKELDDLRCFQRNQDTEWLNQCAQIEDKYKDQIQSLLEQVQISHAERLKAEEDFNQKLEKAQAFFEKELQALKQNQTSALEGEITALRAQQEKLKSDFVAQEKDFRKNIDRLVRQLAEAEDELEARKKEEEALRNELKNRDSSSQSISDQVQQLSAEKATVLKRLLEVETELAASKERCADQAADLLKKSALMGELEANKLQKAALVEELTKKIQVLQQQVSRLEAERSSLQDQQKSLTEQEMQMASLRQAVEDLTVEKVTMQQRHEMEVKSLRQKLEEDVKDVTRVFEGKMAAADRQYGEERDRERKAAAEVLVQTKQELQSKFTEDLNQLRSERDAMQVEFDRIKADLSSRCKQAEEEVNRLSMLIKESEQGLGSASSHINSLKEAASALKTELEKTRAELKSAKISSANLQAELDKLRALYNSKTTEWQYELKAKLEKLATELDDKWKDTMRYECSKLREELIAQKDDEKKAALQHLSLLKDEEIAADRAGFENRIAHLNRQISELRQKLDIAHSSSEEEQNKLRTELEAEQARLQAEMLQAAEDYALKIQRMEEMHLSALQKAIEQKEKERVEMEQDLKMSHVEDLKAQMSAHKAALASAQDTADKTLKEHMREAENKHRLEQDALRAELHEKLERELQNLHKSHESEVRCARMELERAVEISKQKERDHQLQVEELREEISQRETHIVKLKDDIKRLQANIASLNRAVEEKERQTLKICNELKEQLRQREEQLKWEHKAVMDNLNIDHAKESQEMVYQFNQAQDILKDKISELQIMLQEAADRYKNRDSRPEDLELIQQLREEVLEREMRVKQLIDEKRFYQLELVNRETNFNKVFNSSPNVGILNPLSMKHKKKGETVSLKHSSSPSLAGPQRLDPLPGSPLHENALNPARPLPQPAFSKKFVK